MPPKGNHMTIQEILSQRIANNADPECAALAALDAVKAFEKQQDTRTPIQRASDTRRINTAKRKATFTQRRQLAARLREMLLDQTITPIARDHALALLSRYEF